MKITESKLRQMIRGVIKEFTSSATATGAKKGGYQSSDRKSAQTDFDTKSADYDTKSAEYDTSVAARDDSKRYRKSAGKGGGYTYSATIPKGQSGWATNPDWTSQSADVTTKGGAKLSAQRAKTSAKSTLDTAKASDLEKTVPTEKPPAGGGAGYGTGKSAGKGKGKKKKN